MNFLELGVEHLQFSVAAIELSCSFCTPTSASFALKTGNHRGWIDVHFPCQGHIKLQIRGSLPEECLEFAKAKELIFALRRHLKISETETFEAVFFKPTKVFQIEQPTDREGMTDRILTTRKFSPPQ